MSDFSDLKLMRKNFQLEDNFFLNDWFCSVRLSGIEDKEQFCASKSQKIFSKVYPNRKFRENNPTALKSFCVIGHTTKDGLYHPAAHFLFQDVEYKSSTVGSFRELLKKTLRTDRTFPADVDVRRVSEFVDTSTGEIRGGTKSVFDYVLLHQGSDATVVLDAIRMDFLSKR